MKPRPASLRAKASMDWKDAIVVVLVMEVTGMPEMAAAPGPSVLAAKEWLPALVPSTLP